MVPGLVQGRACRLLLDAEQLDPDAAGRRLARALTPGTPAADGAAFVEGFLAGSGTVLLHDRALLGLLDDWIASLPADGFADTLPLLRRTFATFEPSERRLIGELVRRGGAGTGGAHGDEALDEERAAAALATMADSAGGGPVNEDERLRRWRLVLGGADDGTGRRSHRRGRGDGRRTRGAVRAGAGRWVGRSAPGRSRPELARRWRAGWATSAGTSRPRSSRSCNATPSNAST